MKTLFKKYLLTKAPFTEGELQTLLSAGQIKHYAKGDTIFVQGNYWNFNGFVCSGLVCTVQEEGVQRGVVSFAGENYWVGDRRSLLTDTPMPHTAVALEDTTVLLIPHADFEQLRVLVPAFNDVVYTLVQNAVQDARRHICAGTVMSDTERYTTFCAERPGLAQRIPAPILASYLKMSTENLLKAMDDEYPVFGIKGMQQVSA
ncbi:Crp/Fnr family transcriptional regulator [Flavobacterium sp. RHBU_3]|uniref:Crp/Fnr family transcriptional regulator n=1 Tax=Flavobacterium sp. RHBU_3 TaxID=3391184 RepID=UPI003984714E